MSKDSDKIFDLGNPIAETIKLRDELKLACKDNDEEKIKECLAKIREHFPDMFAFAEANKEYKKEKNYFDITFVNDIEDEELNKKAEEDYLASKKDKI